LSCATLKRSQEPAGASRRQRGKPRGTNCDWGKRQSGLARQCLPRCPIVSLAD
jgi:hypothetical protein